MRPGLAWNGKSAFSASEVRMSEALKGGGPEEGGNRVGRNLTRPNRGFRCRHPQKSISTKDETAITAL